MYRAAWPDVFVFVEWRTANKLEMGSVAGRIVKTQNFVEAIN
jgi:hypothetical protein